MFGMALLIIIGFFAAKWFGLPKIEVYPFGVPYLLFQSNSKKYKIEE
jgi:hypothetical protein